VGHNASSHAGGCGGARERAGHERVIEGGREEPPLYGPGEEPAPGTGGRADGARREPRDRLLRHSGERLGAFEPGGGGGGGDGGFVRQQEEDGGGERRGDVGAERGPGYGPEHGGLTRMPPSSCSRPPWPPQSITTPQPHPANPSYLVAGWLGVGVGGGASADPAITEGSAVEGEGKGHAFGVGMSDQGRKTRHEGGSSSWGKVLGMWARERGMWGRL
jgi:hypothetical protein